MAASRRHRRGHRPNPRAHDEGEVKVSSDYEPIEVKKTRERLTPKSQVAVADMVGGEPFPKIDWQPSSPEACRNLATNKLS
jgi:hypothetical protein